MNYVCEQIFYNFHKIIEFRILLQNLVINQTNTNIIINYRCDIISQHQSLIQLQNLYYQLLEHKCKINKGKQKSIKMQT